MKKVNFLSAFFACLVYVVLHLLVPGYVDIGLVAFVKYMLYIAPALGLVWCLYGSMSRHRVWWQLVCAGIVVINVTFETSVSLASNHVAAEEYVFFPFDIIHMLISLLILLLLVLITWRLMRQRNFEMIRYVFFIFLVLGSSNLLINIRFMIFKNKDISFLFRSAERDPYQYEFPPYQSDSISYQRINDSFASIYNDQPVLIDPDSAYAVGDTLLPEE